jgi:hypothetical protein
MGKRGERPCLEQVPKQKSQGQLRENAEELAACRLAVTLFKVVPAWHCPDLKGQGGGGKRFALESA